MDRKLLEKYIDGIASGTERKEVVEWIVESEENKREYIRLKTRAALKNLPYTLSMDSTYEERVAPRGNKRKVTVWGVITRVAAILFFPLVLYNVLQLLNQDTEYEKIIATMPDTGLFTQQEALVEYKVNTGVKGFVTLPDGSEVWLNSDSRVSFPAQFDTLNRKIRLEGEAYFKVKSNPRWPMYITCKNNVVVQVVGTEFNLTTYANDDNIKLLLVSGKLDILDPNNKRVIKVQQNEEVTIYDLSEAIPEKGCPVIYNSIAWKEGLLIFDNTLMSEVVKRLDRWYGVQIEVENKELLAYRFTATFKSESLDRVLNVLKISSDIDYQINDTLVRLKL